MMSVRDTIANEAAKGPLGGRKPKKGPKDATRAAAARKNWKSNRAAIVAGIKKFWASAEGKQLRAKIARYRSTKESEELDLDNKLLKYFEDEEAPEVLEALKDLLEDTDEADVIIEASLDEDEPTDETDPVLEAVIKARRKHRVDPERSRLMKKVRARNKAAFARGAKLATKTKKSKGIYKALGKFNSKREQNGSADLLSRANAFLEGKELPVVESKYAKEIHEALVQVVESVLKKECKNAGVKYDEGSAQEVIAGMLKDQGVGSVEELASNISEAVQAAVVAWNE